MRVVTDIFSPRGLVQLCVLTPETVHYKPIYSNQPVATRLLLIPAPVKTPCPQIFSYRLDCRLSPEEYQAGLIGLHGLYATPDYLCHSHTLIALLSYFYYLHTSYVSLQKSWSDFLDLSILYNNQMSWLWLNWMKQYIQQNTETYCKKKKTQPKTETHCKNKNHNEIQKCTANR